MNDETRRFSRASTRLPITISFADKETVQGEVHNLSMVGLFVQTRQTAPEGSPCEVTFEVEPLKPIRAQCSVIYCDKNGMGLEITGVENVSFEYLRAFVVAQSEDPKACEDNILANMGNLPAMY